MSTVLSRNLMAQLKLAGMAAAFERAVKDATEQHWSGTEFINVLLQAESDHRGERSLILSMPSAKARLIAPIEVKR